MGDLLRELIPLGVVGALSPLPIIAVITLLMSRGGLAKSIGFASAVIGVYVVIGAVALRAASVDAGSSEQGSAITGTIVVALGLLLMAMAFKQLVGAPDPDAVPPKFMAKLDTMSVGGAIGFGAVIALINLKQLGIYLAGVARIVNADVSTAEGWVALAIFLVLIQIGVIGVVVAYALARDRVTRVLGQFQDWLLARSRVIGIVLGFVVGAWFVIEGVAQF